MREIIQLANREVKSEDGDYIQDGRLYCGKCHTPKQCWIKLFERLRLVACQCQCQSQATQQQLEEEHKRQEMVRIGQMRSAGLQDRSLQQWTFGQDDGQRPDLVDKARRYCARWGKMYEQNIGLLLWGDVGTGKSFLAACIANKLIARQVPVLMTSFPRIANAMNTGWGEDRNTYIRSLNAYKLLIIDDLGAERESDAMQEQVYQIIDSRYRSRQPLVVTTNLTLEELKHPRDMRCSRIYDRVLEMTVPIKCQGESRRRQIHDNKRELAAKEILGDFI